MLRPNLARLPAARLPVRRCRFLLFQDAVYMLDVSRSLLGITCSSKGLVAGDLVIHHEGARTHESCWPWPYA